MTATDELAAIHRSILEEPDEDTHRLVYADRLDERGEPGDAERAEFIRVQVEIANTPSEMEFNRLAHQVEWESLRTEERHGKSFSLTIPRDRVGVMTYPGANPKYLELRRREWQLWDDSVCEEMAQESSWEWSWPESGTGLSLPDLANTRRGFVESLRIPAESWLHHADAIYWHPSQTDECKPCRGYGTHWGPTACECCDGTGRIPRPFVPTAHPIREVRLTTWPDGGLFPMLDVHRPARKFTSPRWPGVTFTLPPEPV